MATEKRLVYASEVEEIFNFVEHECSDSYEAFKVAINKATTVDAVKVVHGRWVDHMVRDWRCSECGEKIHKVRSVDGYCYDDKPNYCPNCGAKMDGDGNG